jgi:hypothetical protein
MQYEGKICTVSQLHILHYYLTRPWPVVRHTSFCHPGSSLFREILEYFTLLLALGWLREAERKFE